MADSLFAGHLCATHVGQDLLMVDDEDYAADGDGWSILEVRHKRGKDTVMIGIQRRSSVRVGQGDHRMLFVDARTVITINGGAWA